MNNQQSLSTVGQTYKDFTVTKVVPIPELQCTLRELIHIPTGAQVMHIANDDPENLFCLSFRTWPDSSDGVAHILEHTVLCGSEKYPVKDPFFAMTRRSLNTFMNALTGSDFTCYPAATQVPQDFYNLLEVYLDAVFHPNLRKLSFLQEGWRLEFSNPTDHESPLEYKGVVFNEMKGAMSSPDARLMQAMNAALFAGLTYSHNSGGLPKDIPNLTYEELHEFYKKYYNPSRCLFFFYGNMPLEGHLDFIHEKTLNGLEKAEPLPPLPQMTRFNAPIKQELGFPIRPDEDPTDKAVIGFGWLTCHILEQQVLLALSVLEIILMFSDASLLKRELLKSGLCKQASCYIDGEISEVPVFLILKGCNPESADKLEEVIRKTLEDIIKSGIPQDMVENAIHQLEFQRSEITGEHAPFGLSLFMRSALLKQHNGQPEDGLIIHSLFDALRRRIYEDPQYLTSLIHSYILTNPHEVRIVMKPEKELAAKELEEEKNALEALKAKMDQKSKEQLILQAQELAALQEEEKDHNQDLLPKLTLKDVPKDSVDYSLWKEKAGQLTVFHHNTFTNGIVYADLIFELPNLTDDEIFYAQLLAFLMAQVGAGGRSYIDNLNYIQAHTGGVWSFYSLNVQAQDYNSYSPFFAVHGKSLHRKVDKLFPLLRDMVTTPDFTDISRLKEIILKHYTTLQGNLTQNAMRYAMNLAASSLDIPSSITNKWFGIDYFIKIRDIVHHIDEVMPDIVGKLISLKSKLFGVENPHLVLSCDAKMYAQLKSEKFYGLQDIETHPIQPWKGPDKKSPFIRQGRIIASPVAFISKGFKTVPFVHPDTPALDVASHLFDNLTLHQKLREQGGAYGGGAVKHDLSGNFFIYSYRDPNIVSSLQAFEDAVSNVLNGDFDEDDLEEAKLEIIQSLDSPTSPGSRSQVAYGWIREGRPLEVRQAYREKLLALTRDDVIRVVKQHIIPNMNSGSTVVFAGDELLERENKLINPPLDILPI